MHHLRVILLLIMGLASLSMFGAIPAALYASTTYIFKQEQEKAKAKKTSNDPFINQLNTKTDRHNAHNPVEKVFLHTDKDMFSKGETIWYSAYVVMGPSHQYTNSSKVVHVDLISSEGEIVKSQTHALTNGKSTGALELPKNLQEGPYQLRSYTQWMRNSDSHFFFTKTLSIINSNNKQDVSQGLDYNIDLQFFPEGGHLVADIPVIVSFKAIGSDGLPKELKGKILNSVGSTIATLRTFDRGSGFFQITPKKGENYYAELDDGTQYSLPKILDQGYVVTVNNRNSNKIKVTVKASDSLGHRPVYVTGYMRQKNYFHRKFEFDQDQMLQFEMSKADIPSGVLTLTLFDMQNKPWCERPIFINTEEEIVINTKLLSNKFVKRGKVRVEINATDIQGKPIITNLSLAATDAGQVLKSRGSGTILSHFLLESEIKGHVTDPGLLFGNQKLMTIQQLDLVMLTNGWRKYDWPEVWKDVKPKKEFPFAQGLTVSGTAFSTKDKLMPNATLNVMSKSGDKLGMFSTKTDLDGTFSIPNFNFDGASDIVFNAYNYQDKALDVKVKLNHNKIKVPEAKFKNSIFKQTQVVDAYDIHSVTRSRTKALLDSYRVTKLDEVVVTEKKKKKSRNQTPSTYGMEPDATLYAEDYTGFPTVSQLLQLFSGVVVWHGPSSSAVSIRNGGPPLFVLDGIPRADLAEQIRWMSTLDIERVELLKGPRAAMWGSRGANGVILIYTKRGGGLTYDPVLSPEFPISGHALKKVFYSPKYNINKKEHKIPDYRATLYWNSNIETDENGNASVEFYNSDNARQLQLSIEGMSSNGTLGTYLQTFDENELLNVIAQ